MLLLVLVLVFLACFLVFRFATADGDFTLLAKGSVKREEVEDKVVWITGASRGIGEALAKQFASLGAKLILSARQESELERVKSELRGKHVPDGVKILPLDLTSGDESLREAVRQAESFFSPAGIDYMVHNAAYERPKTAVLDATSEALLATFNVNVFGTIALTRHLAPFMLKRGRGHFVVVSSAAGKNPSPGQAIYSASKYAVNGYFHTLRSELCQRGIKVTVVCPGPIDTSKSTGDASSLGQSPHTERRVLADRCAELIIVAATHGLKEAWISYQIGRKRVEAAEQKSSTYAWDLLFGKGKKRA
ncbi:uncharacterized protein LOC116249091 isoform X2 [Nymphaea colorata]|uniref:uncharacterized protein LOC116249091 isoform X2 n=1 Tax=Nymphaea colorata TaxID=210225 RepID=UPI00129E9BEA|nr:uncharacterized protein LOC116249091 isoform X2 [Nymphaea colorata]